MTIDDDDQLLNRLGEIFATDLGHRPSADELTAFRATLLASAGQHDDRPLDAECAPPADAQTETDGVVVPFVRPRRRLARQLAVTGAAAAITLSGLTAVAAAANNGVLPTPARVVAHAVGLPVDSVELARAKDDLRRLRGADDEQLPEAVERTEKALAALSEDERGHVSDEAERDLAGAHERLGKRGPGNGSGGSGGSGGGNSGPGGSGRSGDGAETTPTSAGGVGGPATTADDTGRQSGGGNSGGDDPASGGGTSVSTTSVATSGSDGSGGGGSGSGGDAGSGSGGSGSGGSGSGGDTGSGSGGDTGSGSDPPTTSSSGSGGSGSGSGSRTTATTQSPSGKPVQSPSTTSSSSDTTAGGKGGGGGSKP